MVKFSRLKLCISFLVLMSLIAGTTLFVSKWTSAHAASAKASEASWSQLGYNPQHTNFNSQEHVLNSSNVAGLQLAWSYSSGSLGRFATFSPSPVVADGIVFTSSSDAKLYALNSRTGQRKWSYYAGSNINASPAVANGIVYMSTSGYNSGQHSSSTIFAIDTQTGVLKWSSSVEDTYYTSPTVFDNVVYVGAYHLHSVSGTVYALDAQTGIVKWSYTTEGGIFDSPTIANGFVYVGGEFDSNVYALNALTGAVHWLYSTGGNILFPTVVVHGVVYINSVGDNLYALDALTGKVKWKNPTTSSSALAVANNVIYVAAEQSLDAVDANKGMLKWSVASSYANPVVANGMVYVGAYGQLNAISVQKGETVWSYALSYFFTSPVIVNGMVYASTDNNTLYAFHLPHMTS